MRCAPRWRASTVGTASRHQHSPWRSGTTRHTQPPTARQLLPSASSNPHADREWCLQILPAFQRNEGWLAALASPQMNWWECNYRLLVQVPRTADQRFRLVLPLRLPTPPPWPHLRNSSLRQCRQAMTSLAILHRCQHNLRRTGRVRAYQTLQTPWRIVR